MAALAAGLPFTWGPVRCSRASRAALLRCPRTPSARMAALAAGLAWPGRTSAVAAVPL